MRAARIASHAAFGAKRKKHGLKAHAECGCKLTQHAVPFAFVTDVSHVSVKTPS